jgi:hypothetical protein
MAGETIMNESEGLKKLYERLGYSPLDRMRRERSRLLSESDWRELPGYPGNDQAEWMTYRQALRDLPEVETPFLDEDGNLTNVTWPTPPGDN